MKLLFELEISSAFDKDNIVKSLTNSGYIIGTEYIKSGTNFYCDDKSYWSIKIYDNSSYDYSKYELVKPICFSVSSGDEDFHKRFLKWLENGTVALIEDK